MIYQIENDLRQVTESGQWDARLIRFPHWGDATFTNPTIDYTSRAPTPVEFIGELARLQQVDFPYLDQGILPLMSMRMLMVLLSTGEFPYRLHPTRIYDLSVQDQVVELQDGERTQTVITDPTLYTDTFFLVQLLEWCDVLDRQRTILAKSEYNARGKRIGVIGMRAKEADSLYLDSEAIEKLALTVPEMTLPGAFRIKDLSTRLLCTRKTKQACRDAGLKGVSFRPIPTPLESGDRAVDGGYRLLPEETLSSFDMDSG